MLVRLQIASSFDMLDFVQLISDRLGAIAGLDDDAIHWVGVAVREGVINAIKHGNREDVAKRVTIEFALRGLRWHATRSSFESPIKAAGFEPDAVADPLAPENVLKSSGRGIFFMRSFMDDISLRRMPDGGMEVRW